MPIAVQQILNTLNTFDRVLYNVFYRVLRFTQDALRFFGSIYTPWDWEGIVPYNGEG